MGFIKSLFFNFLPIWLLIVILITAILGAAYFKDKRFLTSSAFPVHILRAFILITIGSYWFADTNGFISTLGYMLGTGIKFTVIYAIVRFCSDAFTANNQEIKKPWSLKN